MIEDGLVVGCDDGCDEGTVEGCTEGVMEGWEDGCSEGFDEGWEDGFEEGIEDGDEGDRVGEFENPGDTCVPDPIVLVVNPPAEVAKRRLLPNPLPQNMPVSVHAKVAFLLSLLYSMTVQLSSGLNEEPSYVNVRGNILS